MTESPEVMVTSARKYEVRYGVTLKQQVDLTLSCGHKQTVDGGHPHARATVSARVRCLDCWLDTAEGKENLVEFVGKYSGI